LHFDFTKCIELDLSVDKKVLMIFICYQL